MSAKTTPYFFPLFVSITLMGLIIVPFSVKSQNKIYLEAGSIEGKLNEVTRDRVKFTRTENPGQLYSVNRNSVKIIFNESGNFLIPEALDQFGNTSEDASVADFINSSGSLSDATDKIFTLNNKEFSGKIINEDPSSFTINTGRQTPLNIKRSEVVCVVYKSGKHQLIASVSASVDALKNIANNKASLALQNEISAIPEKKEVPSPAPAVVTEEKKEEPVIKPAEPPVVKEKEITPPPPTVVTEEKKEEPVKKTIEEPIVKEKESPPPAPVVIEEKKEEPVKKTIEEPVVKEKESAPPSPVVIEEKKKEIPVIEKPKPAVKVDSVKIKLMQERTYDSLVSVGNRLLLSDLSLSLAAFRKVLEVKPGDYYATKQIRYLESAMTKKEEVKKVDEEAKKLEEAETKYKEALKKGDQLKLEKNYEAALSAYKEVLELRPDDAYAKRMVEILTYQINLKKNASEENKP